MSRLWTLYTTALTERPVFTNTCTACVIGVLGDLLAQKIEARSVMGPWDIGRSLQVMGWSLTMGGAPMYYWYRYLDKLWPNPPTLRKVACKVAVNQVFAATTMNSLFFGYTQLVQKGPWGFWSNWRSKLADDLLPTMKGSVMFWTPIHVFNFFFIPPSFRVLYLSCGLVAWTAFISMTAYKPPKQPQGHRDTQSDVDASAAATTAATATVTTTPPSSERQQHRQSPDSQQLQIKQLQMPPPSTSSSSSSSFQEQHQRPSTISTTLLQPAASKDRHPL